MTDFMEEDLEYDPEDRGELEGEEYRRSQARTFLEVSSDLRFANTQYLEEIDAATFRPIKIILMAEVLSMAIPGKDVYLMPGWLRLNARYGEIRPKDKKPLDPEHYLARGAFFRELMKQYGMVGRTQAEAPKERGPTMIDVQSMFMEED